MRNPKAVQENFAAVWNAATLIKAPSYLESVENGQLSGGLAASVIENTRFLANHIGNKQYWDAEIATRMQHGWTMPQEDRSMMANATKSVKWMRITEDAECERKNALAVEKNHRLDGDGRLTGSWPMGFTPSDGFIPTRCEHTEKTYGQSEMPEGAYELIKARGDIIPKVELSGAYRQALGIVEKLLSTGEVAVNTEEELYCLVRAKTEEMGDPAKVKREEEENAIKRFL